MPGWIPDLALNLIAEIIGIVATVFFVDRLLKKIESRKLLPSRNFLYSRLINHLDNVLLNSLPPTANPNIFYVYEFGDVVVTTTEENIELSNVDINKKFLQKSRKYSGKLSLNNKIRALNELSQEKDEIDKILSSAIVLIEPELLSSLMKLQRVLGDARGIIRTIHFSQETDQKIIQISEINRSVASSFSSLIFFAAESALEAKKSIIQKATKKTSPSDFVSKLKKWN